MPILAREIDLFPSNLLDEIALAEDDNSQWWVLYTRSRQEKHLMRRLFEREVPFYCPIIPTRKVSPKGRVCISHLPLFSCYVFIYGDDQTQKLAITNDCVVRCLPVPADLDLASELQQISRLIATELPLTQEQRLEPGNPVEIKHGSLRGMRGVVLQRRGKTRLLLSVSFLQIGVSIEVDDSFVELL